MLRIYEVALSMVRELRGVRLRDADLSRQLRRAASSVVLNLAEGSGSRDGNRRLRYETALGSAREVGACLDVAVAWGEIGEPAAVRALLREIVGTLIRVTR